MGGIIVLILAIAEGVGIAAYMYLSTAKKRSSVKSSMNKLNDVLKERVLLRDEIETLYESMVDVGSFIKMLEEFNSLQESLRAERGRITITQAELETVESRLRELEEIERELEASGIETKQELNILKKKEEELAGRNNSLKQQIAASTEQLDQLLEELQTNTKVKDQILTMKTELVLTQERIDTLLLQIEQGNEQYFIMKKRYDALDIEYAQLYEKFSESESGDEKNS